MADQYLQRNQLDRLIGRLERELREPNQQRELSLCLAQAHAASGDYATARVELERLLASERQGHARCSASSRAWPSRRGTSATRPRSIRSRRSTSPRAPEGNARLAQLYSGRRDRRGRGLSGPSLANENEDSDPGPRQRSTRLLSQGKNDSVQTITERLLVKHPGDWEALYREGVALEALGKPPTPPGGSERSSTSSWSTTSRARPAGPDQEASSGRRRIAQAAAPGPRTRAVAASFPIQGRGSRRPRRSAIAVKLDTEEQYSTAGLEPGTWTPSRLRPGPDGRDRLALRPPAAKDKRSPTSVKSPPGKPRDKAARPTPGPTGTGTTSSSSGPTGRLSSRPPATSSKRSRPTDSAKPSYRLPQSSLPGTGRSKPGRQTRSSTRARPRSTGRRPCRPRNSTGSWPAIATFRKRKPEIWSPDVILMATSTPSSSGPSGGTSCRAVLPRDPRRGRRTSTPSTPPSTLVAAERGDVDNLLKPPGAKSDRLRAGQALDFVMPPRHDYEPGTAIACSPRSMNKRADAKAYVDVPAAAARPLPRRHAVARIAVARTGQGEARARRARIQGELLLRIYVGKKAEVHRRSTIPSPTPTSTSRRSRSSATPTSSTSATTCLSDLVGPPPGRGRPAPRVGEGLPAAGPRPTVAWWDDDKDEALRDLTRAVEIGPGDVDLRLGLAELQARRGEPVEALDLVDAVRAARPEGDAAPRGSWPSAWRSWPETSSGRGRRRSGCSGSGSTRDTQVQLAGQMNQLGMHELAEAVLARARRRAGAIPASLVALMLQYQKQARQGRHRLPGRQPDPPGL